VIEFPDKRKCIEPGIFLRKSMLNEKIIFYSHQDAPWIPVVHY
jgi:hypothetical protein